jgi:hypothetical protein
MAAMDRFESTLAQLSPAQHHMLAEYITNVREQLAMARSEDARIRVLEMFQEESHERLQGARLR